MIKISAAFTKKVPGEEPYSSDGVHLGVEIEVPDQVLGDEREFSQAVRRLFAQARAEVEQQVTAPTRELNGHNGRTHRGGDGAARSAAPSRRRDELASKKQLDFLLSLARRNANLGPNDLMAEAGVERLTDITKNEASALIDRFNGAAR